MNLYRIPWGWDYHGYGGIIIMAESEESALEKGKLFYASLEHKHKYGSGGSDPEWSRIIKIDGDVFEESGCDC